MARGVVQLLEQGKVDVRLDIAHEAGITVPIPSAPEIPTVLTHADIREPGFAQAGTGQEAAKTAARDNHLHMIIDGGACNIRRPRVLAEIREFSMAGRE